MFTKSGVMLILFTVYFVHNFLIESVIILPGLKHWGLSNWARSLLVHIQTSVSRDLTSGLPESAVTVICYRPACGKNLNYFVLFRVFNDLLFSLLLYCPWYWSSRWSSSGDFLRISRSISAQKMNPSFLLLNSFLEIIPPSIWYSSKLLSSLWSRCLWCLPEELRALLCDELSLYLLDCFKLLFLNELFDFVGDDVGGWWGVMDITVILSPPSSLEIKIAWDVTWPGKYFHCICYLACFDGDTPFLILDLLLSFCWSIISRLWPALQYCRYD